MTAAPRGSEPCVAESRYGDHLYVRTYSRPARRMFRKTFHLRCWRCDLLVEEPR